MILKLLVVVVDVDDDGDDCDDGNDRDKADLPEDKRALYTSSPESLGPFKNSLSYRI